MGGHPQPHQGDRLQRQRLQGFHRSRALQAGRAPGGKTDKVLTRQLDELRSDIYGMAAYDLLKTATEIFLLLNCGVKIEGKDLATGESLFDKYEEAIDLGETVSLDEISERLRAYLGEGRLPYINRILRDAFSDEKIIDRVHCEGVI